LVFYSSIITMMHGPINIRLTSLFRCLGRTKVSVQGRGFVCEHFVIRYVFTVSSC